MPEGHSTQKNLMTRSITVISVFAGGGGSSLGYRMAGCKELLAVDFDSHACQTLRNNFDFPVWEKDVCHVKAADILEFCNLKPGELDILDGSPPCQGFSLQGNRIVSDVRNSLFNEYIRLIKGIQPKVFVMENVSDMIKGKMRGYFIEIMTSLKKLDYNVKCKILNAKYYKVPQNRKRLIWIGVRKDLNKEPVYPKASTDIVTVREALKNVKNKTFLCASSLETDRWPNTAPGKPLGVFRSIVRVHPDKPSPAILKSHPFFHPSECRKLTVEEGKRLQGFPDDFKLEGSFTIQWNRIGDSVPPPMMAAIAKTIIKEIL